MTKNLEQQFPEIHRRMSWYLKYHALLLTMLEHPEESGHTKEQIDKALLGTHELEAKFLKDRLRSEQLKEEYENREKGIGLLREKVVMSKDGIPYERYITSYVGVSLSKDDDE